MWRAVLRPPGWFLPSAWMLQLQRLFLPAALHMPSDLACRMSANSLGLSILNGPLVCPVCHFLYWRATAFPCTAASMVTSQDLTQSMRIYSSVSISSSTPVWIWRRRACCSLSGQQRERLATESPCGAKLVELSVLSCLLSVCHSFWHCKRANPLCGPTCM